VNAATGKSAIAAMVMMDFVFIVCVLKVWVGQAVFIGR
jgi:hypothetical protein